MADKPADEAKESAGLVVKLAYTNIFTLNIMEKLYLRKYLIEYTLPIMI